jgi:hypothetical protein
MHRGANPHRKRSSLRIEAHGGARGPRNLDAAQTHRNVKVRRTHGLRLSASMGAWLAARAGVTFTYLLHDLIGLVGSNITVPRHHPAGDPVLACAAP